MFAVTNDPVRDAEAYIAQQEDRPYMECDICHGPIYYGDADRYGDDVYHINDLDICSGCIQDYIKDLRRELVG